MRNKLWDLRIPCQLVQQMGQYVKVQLDRTFKHCQNSVWFFQLAHSDVQGENKSSSEWLPNVWQIKPVADGVSAHPPFIGPKSTNKN
jgi:hypothetical protein